jgi:phosphatidylserine decarboxylase
MRKPTAAVCREGLPIIFGGAFVTLVFAVLGWVFLTILGLAFTLLSLNFFRDPERVTPRDPDVAVSPADGRVVKVGRAKDPFTGWEMTVVCVFMNVFNVHVNRMPVSGTVRGIRYWPGKFINASLDKASEGNERNGLQIVDSLGKSWTVVQIAGLVARRIVCWAQEGDEIPVGERFGLIKFGSRVDVYLPPEYKPTITVGQKVLAGQTIIAEKSD